MNAMHAHRRLPDVTTASQAFDWSAHCKLGIVLSALAAVIANGLVGRVSETTIVVGVIVVASLMAWHRVAPLPGAEEAGGRHD